MELHAICHFPTATTSAKFESKRESRFTYGRPVQQRVQSKVCLRRITESVLNKTLTTKCTIVLCFTALNKTYYKG